MFGKIFVVATPIGHLDDISLRAIETLKMVDLILAEDTRHSRILLDRYQIATKCLSLHAFNEKKKTQSLIAQLKLGLSCALISDAGTPMIQDPGAYLIQMAHKEGIQVSPVPGACAPIAALSASGLVSKKFIFEGFIPQGKETKIKYFSSLKAETRPIIFFEAPHRILKSLEAMLAVYGSEREVLLAREITKVFETIRKAPLEVLFKWVKNAPNQCKGEMVLIIAGDNLCATSALKASELEILKQLLQALPLNQAVKLCSSIFNIQKKKLYAAALNIKASHAPH